MSNTTQDKTVWSVSVDSSTPAAPTATLSVSLNGAAAQATKLKGVCYAPCPINASSGAGPNLGDWFWDGFSGTGYDIKGWDPLWARDLPNLRKLGANTIRVYSMLSRQLTSDGGYPSPWNSGQLFTHTKFLDACWNGGVDPIYVMVGIPLPQAMFWKSMYDTTPQSEIDFWNNVLTETVQQVSGHPAVLGFIIQNEVDAGPVTYGSDTAAVTFWWGQVAALSAAAKAVASDKLVGMAVHDDPNICGQCQSYMANCPGIDFWGVNTYQTQTFQPVFGQTEPGPGYNGLTGAALKPVILTEFGIPGTGRRTADDPSTIYSDSATQTAAAGVVSAMVPQAFGAAPPSLPAYPVGLCLGMYYFEYCDEWWNQGGAPNIYTWWSGNPAAGFPNGYWDQDGFGIWGQERGGGLANDAPTWSQSGGYGGPALPVDTLVERPPLRSAVKAAFAGA